MIGRAGGGKIVITKSGLSGRADAVSRCGEGVDEGCVAQAAGLAELAADGALP